MSLSAREMTRRRASGVLIRTEYDRPPIGGVVAGANPLNGSHPPPEDLSGERREVDP